MKREELNFILQEGEGFKIEFKEHISEIDKSVNFVHRNTCLAYEIKDIRRKEIP